MNPDYSSSATAKLFKKAEDTFQSFSYPVKENGEKLIKVYQPFTVEGAGEVWFLGLTVPDAEVNTAVIRIRFIESFIFILTLLVVIVLAYFAIRRVVKEMIKGVAAMKNIAQGDGDLTVRMEVKNEMNLVRCIPILIRQ